MEQKNLSLEEEFGQLTEKAKILQQEITQVKNRRNQIHALLCKKFMENGVDAVEFPSFKLYFYPPERISVYTNRRCGKKTIVVG